MSQPFEWRSLRLRLPLLTAGLIAGAVAIIAAIAYYEMRTVLVRAASEHQLAVAQQIASVFTKAAEKLDRDGTPASHDPSLREALLHPDGAHIAAAQRVLADRARSSANMTVELWDLHNTRLAVAGAKTAKTAPFVPTRSAVGPLLVIDDTVLTQTQVPVLGVAHDTLGFERELARVSSTSSRQVLGGLIGGQAVLMVGNATGDVWTDLDKLVAGPGAKQKLGVAVTTQNDGARWLGALTVVPGTPWRIWVARPEFEVLAQARSFFLRMALVALVVIVLGGASARLLGKHLIGPLGELTRAAESIAAGDYSTRANVERSDEIGHVAESFNRMAEAIEIARLELENQQVELEAQQAELQEANEELRQSIHQATAARAAEERSNVRSAAIVAGAIDSIITIDEHERIVEFNPAAERLFGRPAQSAIGRQISEIIAAPDPGPAIDGATSNGNGRSFIGEHAHPRGQQLELSAFRADGTELQVDFAVTRIPLDGPAMFTCFVRDLSERKHLEMQLQRSQKMEAVGRLAGGVAHDFNNMLTVIVSYADLVLSDDTVSEALRDDLLQIRSAADRATVLTRQLLAFSRKQVLHPTTLDLNEVIGGVITMLARVMPENIRLSSTLGLSLHQVYVDRGQLEQVLMNLAVNARDAMGNGGALVIETANAELDDAYVAMHPGGQTGPHVVLTVRDTGSGMDAKTRERIFEPFFTTKPVGQGTGLGLATVYGIVRQSGGSIYVYSEPGQGTTFKVYFPAHAGAAASTADQAPAQISAARPLTVLLVEDDPAVRGATEIVLKRLGHQVIAAPDAAAALGLVRGGAGPIDVVLTDAVMPGQSGLELAETLRAERPDLPVVLMSGYAEETINVDERRMRGVVFIEKPFTAPIIAQALEQVRSKTAA